MTGKENLTHDSAQAGEGTFFYYCKSVLQWICHHTTELKVLQCILYILS